MGCFKSAYQEDYELGKKLLSEEQFQEAFLHFEKVFKYSSDETIVYESAKIAADLSENKAKNYQEAVRYLEFVIANSKSFEDSYSALYKKAFIEHKLLYHFESAIKSYQRLLSSSEISIEQSSEIRLNIAKCYYAIHEYASARTELVPLISPTQKVDMRYRAKLLQASILQSENQLDAAIKAYQEALVLDIDDKEKKEGFISLALCYEQKEAYKNALETIKKISPSDDFLKIKLSQLERLVQFQGRRLQR